MVSHVAITCLDSFSWPQVSRRVLDSTELRSLRSRRDLGLNVLRCAHAGGIWSNPKGEGRRGRERRALRRKTSRERREPCGAESGTLCGYAEYAESSNKPKGSRLDRGEVLYKSDSRFRMSIYYRNLASLYICRYSGYTLGQVWDKR